MEFFEFVFAFSIVFVLPLAILRTVLDYKKARLQGGGEAAGGVTAGELRRLLRESVEDANAPLLERIETLEEQVRLSLPETVGSASVAEAFGDDFEEELKADPQERTLGRRVTD